MSEEMEIMEDAGFVCKQCGGILDAFQYFHALECFACGYKWK